MEFINLAILLCTYLIRLDGILSHPSSHHNRHSHFGRRQFTGFPGLGGMVGGSGGETGNSGGGGCSKYKIVSARGTGENQAMPTGCMGFVKGLLSAVPGGEKYEVVYPAAMDYMNGPTQGAGDAIQYLQGQHQQCPDQVYVLIGYSEGAMVITQTMNKLPISPSSVAAVALYGNPYFKGGASQNACAAKGGAGVAAAMGVAMPDQFTTLTYDCCIAGDMICQTAGTMMSHMTYPGSQEEQGAVEFASSKLKAALSGKGSSGSDDNNEGYGSYRPRGKKSKHGSSKNGIDESNASPGNQPANQGSGGMGFPSLPGAGGSGGMGGMPSFGGMGGMPSMPSFGGMGGMPKMPSFGGFPGMPHM